MRMYCAKQRASLPFSIGWSATLHVGAATFFRPASVIATLMSVGFMSAEPTICSAVTSLLDGVPRVDAHHERADAERDHERAGDDSADLENSATSHLLVPPV